MTSTTDRVDEVLRWLERRGTQRNRDGMARYGIRSEKAYGVSVTDLRGLAKRLGRDHDLALDLWDTGWYEARMLTGFVDDPALVRPAQMNRWARDFDNWAICDHLCFHLFDQSPYAWPRIKQWSTRREEFVKRAAFALLAGVALHHKREADTPFIRSLSLVERAAADDRNFVKKGVSWALRSIGHRNQTLNAAAIATATRLAESTAAPERWVGKDALRDLTRPAVQKRLAARAQKSGG